MRTRYSIFVPIAAILSGVVLEINQLGIAGKFLPNDVLMKVWPALLVFAALDLLFVQRRVIGAIVVLATAGALLSTQFMPGGWNNPFWQHFLKYWPILLILFGIDCIFSERTVVNTIVIIAGVIVLIYVLLTVMDVPAIHKLPFDINIDLKSIIPTSTFSGSLPQQFIPQQQGPVTSQLIIQSPETAQQIIFEPDGQLSIAMPVQNSAALSLNAASGKVSLKADGNSGQFLSGTVSLESGEKLSHNTNLNGQTAQYVLRSEGHAASENSNWDLGLSPYRTTAVDAVMNNGYIKADLRSMDLSAVNIENRRGPIDVMVPQQTEAQIKIKADDGDIRVYIPGNTSVYCTITGTGQVEYPRYTYNWSNGFLAPRRPGTNTVSIEISSNNGSVKIIETE